MSKKHRGWSEMPSSGDLGALMKCEAEFVWTRNTGESNKDERVREASRRGVVEHDRAQVAMETFHNRPHGTVQPGRKDSKSREDGRCFVASAVYGEQAAETKELRDFRDRVLMPSTVGRGLVRTYYALSPPLAGWLSKHAGCASATRKGLDLFRRAVTR